VTPTEPKLLLTQEVAALLRVHRSTLYRVPGLMSCRVNTGEPRRVRYDAAKVMALLSPKVRRAA
jgi:hypothetical protein